MSFNDKTKQKLKGIGQFIKALLIQYLHPYLVYLFRRFNIIIIWRSFTIRIDLNKE